MSYIPPEDSLIEYPCEFPIKVMGKTHPDLASTITKLVQQHDPSFDADKLETRPSGKGNYTALTYRINAVSREQLDDLYKALHAHAMVSIVL